MLSNEIIRALNKVLNLKNNEEKVFLHEPFFKDTLALKYANECIETGWVSSSGAFVERFENSIKKFTGAKYAIAVNNGTSALRLGLHVIGVKPNDEVLTTPLSFVATANAISHLGAIPNFVDIEESSLGISPLSLSNYLDKIAYLNNGRVINKKSGRIIRAILPVHVFGNPMNILELKKISERWNLPIIEDAAEALGSRIITDNRNIHCGLFGELGIISFNGNKIITTGGGGVIITNNEIHAEKARHLSTTAKKSHPWEFYHDQIGWNDRLPNINAAIGLAQMEILEERLIKKRKLYFKYLEIFSEFEGLEIIKENENLSSNHWLISLRLLSDNPEIVVRNRNKILNKAHKNNIFLRPAWKLINKLPMYKNSPSQNTEIASDQVNRIINLPSSPQLIS